MSRVLNGYMLREAIKRWIMRRDTASKQFGSSLFQFDEDYEGGQIPEDNNPLAISSVFKKADDAVAKLETLQQAYNLKVPVKLRGQTVTLSYAVKRVGGAGRIDKMWRSAAVDDGTERHYSRQITRQDGERRARKMVTMPIALGQSDDSARFAGEIRAAIAQANSTEIPLSDLSLAGISAPDVEELFS